MKPRVGCVGVGWIGRNRLQALLQSGTVEVVGVADPSTSNAVAAAQLAHCEIFRSLEELLNRNLDGLVIATPSALHAQQATTALEHGVAVFCQKPLARTASETADVVAVARQEDRLLGVDLSYRYVEGARQIRNLVQSGELGSIYAADLVFHNAYGPDKPWFYDPALSGGGCVIDLGVHLVDLLLWTIGPAQVSSVASRLFARGEQLSPAPTVVEDFAWAELQLEGGVAARIACSWNLSAGRDAVIESSFYGTAGAARLSNVNGSFYDFRADRYKGTSSTCLAEPPDAWGGRAIVGWGQQLSVSKGFDPEAEQHIAVAEVVDAIYGREVSERSGQPLLEAAGELA
jgi:predicted dehydrogenase